MRHSPSSVNPVNGRPCLDLPYKHTNHQEGDREVFPQAGSVSLLSLVHFPTALVTGTTQTEAEPHQRHQNDEEQPQDSADDDPQLVVDDLWSKQTKRRTL